MKKSGTDYTKLSKEDGNYDWYRSRFQIMYGIPYAISNNDIPKLGIFNVQYAAYCATPPEMCI